MDGLWEGCYSLPWRGWNVVLCTQIFPEYNFFPTVHVSSQIFTAIFIRQSAMNVLHIVIALSFSILVGKVVSVAVGVLKFRSSTVDKISNWEFLTV